MRYDFQEEPEAVNGFSDSDWAGCRRTAKSTSGGCVMKGGHCIKSWSSTQKSISLSSAEAELVAAVKMAAEVLGIQQLMEEWNICLKGCIYVDSSAALGIVNRKGNGKMRHVKIGMLWIQEKRESGELEFEKIAGAINPGDLMTKYLTQKIMDVHLRIMNAEVSEGRSKLAPDL